MAKSSYADKSFWHYKLSKKLKYDVPQVLKVKNIGSFWLHHIISKMIGKETGFV